MRNLSSASPACSSHANPEIPVECQSSRTMPGNMRWSSAISQNPRHSLQNRSFEWAQRLPKPWPPMSVQSAPPIAATVFHDVVVGPVNPMHQMRYSRRAPRLPLQNLSFEWYPRLPMRCQPRSVQILFPIADTFSHGVVVGPVSRVPPINKSSRSLCSLVLNDPGHDLGHAGPAPSGSSASRTPASPPLQSGPWPWRRLGRQR